MKVTVFHRGPAANESELIAFKHLENRLQSTFGGDEWILEELLGVNSEVRIVT
jgi:hypothetical protein